MAALKMVKKRGMGGGWGAAGFLEILDKSTIYLSEMFVMNLSQFSAHPSKMYSLYVKVWKGQKNMCTLLVSKEPPNNIIFASLGFYSCTLWGMGSVACEQCQYQPQLKLD